MGTLLMTQLGQDHGVPVEVCLRGTGLTDARLSDPYGEVSVADSTTVSRSRT